MEADRTMLKTLIVAGVIASGLLVSVDAQARAVPAPTQDEAVGAATTEVAVVAGGCFWGVQGVFQHVMSRHQRECRLSRRR